jgi:hypothetical protein
VKNFKYPLVHGQENCGLRVVSGPRHYDYLYNIVNTTHYIDKDGELVHSKRLNKDEDWENRTRCSDGVRFRISCNVQSSFYRDHYSGNLVESILTSLFSRGVRVSLPTAAYEVRAV